MRGILKDDVFWDINDYNYVKGLDVEVYELEGFPEVYVIYTNRSSDWLPKESVEIIL